MCVCVCTCACVSACLCVCVCVYFLAGLKSSVISFKHIFINRGKKKKSESTIIGHKFFKAINLV